jgi:multidrug transporter EmrE-like cation transporter
MLKQNVQMIGWLLLVISVESFALYYLQKAASEKDKRYLIITMLIYGIPVSLLLYKLLEFRKIGTVNFFWNIGSSLVGFTIGILWFGEKLINLQLIGVLLGFLGLGLVMIGESSTQTKNIIK